MFYTKKSVDAKFGELADNAANMMLDLQRSLRAEIQAAIEADKATQAAAVEKAADERQKSDTPFVEIISDGYDPELGVQLQLDWNEAFVKELKSKGYKGRNDREIVNKWLIEMHKQLAAQFEEHDKV
jgi:hypothetical protein